MSFTDLKRNRTTLFEETKKNVESLKEGGFEKDPDDWYPSVDKAGNGFAIIRFLPPVSSDDLDFVRWWSHEFQDPKTQKYYIENCRSTIYKGKTGVDPVMDFNSKLWKSVPDSDDAAKHPNRIQATRQMRKTNYRANIFVVEDGVNPENNGQVKKFKFGKWVMDKIEEAMFPKFKGDKAMNPFDLWEGANFKIKIVTEKKGGKNQRNYNSSAFEAVSTLGTDKELEAIYNQISGENAEKFSLKKYISPDKFKEYDDLLAWFNLVVDCDTANWKAGMPTNSAPSSSSLESFRAESRLKSEEVAPLRSEAPKDLDTEDKNFFTKLSKADIDDDIPF